MHILHISKHDIKGGAARAAYRLHNGLQTSHKEVNSTMLVDKKGSGDSSVVKRGSWMEEVHQGMRSRLDKIPLLEHNPEKLFSVAWVPDRLKKKVKDIDPDIVHLHWVAGGMLQVQTVREFERPVIWTLHDMWPFTGGCHYAGGCTRFERSCGSCPILESTNENDISNRLWRQKRAVYRDTRLVPVAPSRWMAKCAERSSLFSEKNVRRIPNGLDISKYAKQSMEQARELFGISSDATVVLFGAMGAVSDERKGYRFLRDALKILASERAENDLQLVVFGSEEEDQNQYEFDTMFTGYVPDNRLPSLYRAADTVVVPSVQDNLPNVVLESMAAGTPCVGFRIGGIPDMISHQVDGYLASPGEAEELAEGIQWTLADDERLKRLSHAARSKVEQQFTIEKVCSQYKSLYNEVMPTGSER